ncbi:MAG: zinc ribbon domain-containing protein [Nitrosopumilaceae archaeon]|nr:zinc ribbon domain-containing protein [Nitrosopumilaceae archaeon]
MKFESELKKGSFFLSECPNCQKIVWPPSEYCDQCLQEVNWRKSTGVGKIIEFSRQNNQIFCVAEIENTVRLLGEIISGIPDIGKNVIITDCTIEKENHIVKMKVLE